MVLLDNFQNLQQQLTNHSHRNHGPAKNFSCKCEKQNTNTQITNINSNSLNNKCNIKWQPCLCSQNSTWHAINQKNRIANSPNFWTVCCDYAQEKTTWFHSLSWPPLHKCTKTTSTTKTINILNIFMPQKCWSLFLWLLFLIITIHIKSGHALLSMDSQALIMSAVSSALVDIDDSDGGAGGGGGGLVGNNGDSSDGGTSGGLIVDGVLRGGNGDRNSNAAVDDLVIGDSGSNVGDNDAALYLEKIDLEKSIAAVFNKVAYGSTTTKRSIPDNVFVPSLTTVPTPPLTTFRYRDREKDANEKSLLSSTHNHQQQQQHHQHQQMNLYHRNYDLDLERDHALPTSAPNADILKSNSNPTYPNPNRHHNHERDRHRHLNSTPAPSAVHNLKKGGQQQPQQQQHQFPTIPMYPVDMPSYSPPSRSFFTPPHPPGYQYPFADKPTLRGTNSDTSIGINTGSFVNRRPIPPPSLMPGQERIPYRPPELFSGSGSNNNNGAINNSGDGNSGGNIPNNSNGGKQLAQTPLLPMNNAGIGNGNPGYGLGPNYQLNSDQRKKALNTPAQQKGNGGIGSHKIGDYGDGNINFTNDTQSSTLNGGNNNYNSNNNNGALGHFPSISRILSGSNGRKEDIPEVLLRTVTVRPSFLSPSASDLPLAANHPVQNHQSSSTLDQQQNELNKNRPNGGRYGDNIADVDDRNNRNNNNNNNNDDDVDDGDDDDDDDDDEEDDEEDEEDDFIDGSRSSNGGRGRNGGNGGNGGSFNNENIDEPKTQPKIKQQHNGQKSTQSPFQQNDPNIYSTQIIQNLANVNEKSTRTTTIASQILNNGAGGISNNGAAANNNNGGSASSGKNHHLSQATAAATWTVAWNIHVYLSAILFTVLAVYSIFKMIFYDKLTHLFNQSYFICIHLTLIVICLARIFFLCYDAYNIHLSFPLFISELLLNLPATFLTIAFAILILFLLIRSLNHKNNRYAALMRPLTVVVASSVHVGLCITLHYVESNTSQNQLYLYQTRAYQLNGVINNGGNSGYRGSSSSSSSSSISSGSTTSSGSGIGFGSTNSGSSTAGNLHHQHHFHHTATPPRVLSLICQIIYIFVCLSLGLFYLYVYRILKRVLRNKSQNYIHGYQNLSYAIHITIATALLFVLMAALQVYGAISISTTRPLVSATTDIDWLQCGYQFSLRLIEIAIITLLSWVCGLKTGASKVLQREKGMETHNVSGFALFPCTSSSSQEHFENDYPAICNANTNLHTYTLRTGKPIYDDSFALNSLGMENGPGGGGGGGPTTTAAAAAASSSSSSSSQSHHHHHHHHHLHQQSHHQSSSSSTSSTAAVAASTRHAGSMICSGGSAQANDFSGNDFVGRNYETQSVRSSIHDSERIISDGEFLNDTGTMPDHYENPNFELRSTAIGATSNHHLTTTVMQQQPHHHLHHHHHHHQQHPHQHHQQQQQRDLILDNCYSEPLSSQQSLDSFGIGGGVVGGSGSNSAGIGTNADHTSISGRSNGNFDFQNFEKPLFDRPTMTATTQAINLGTEFRASKNLKALKNGGQQNHLHNTSGGACSSGTQIGSGHLDRLQYENPERRSSNSNHSTAYASGRNFNNFNFNNQNSFERRSGSGTGGGLRKSGTLNNIGGIHGSRNGSGGSNSSSGNNCGVSNGSHVVGNNGGTGRASGIQTLSSSSSRSMQHNQQQQHLQRNTNGRSSTTMTSIQQQQQPATTTSKHQQHHHLQQQHPQKKDRNRSSIERRSTSHLASSSGGGVSSVGGGSYIMPEDGYNNPYHDTISNSSSDNSGGIGASSSGGIGSTAADLDGIGGTGSGNSGLRSMSHQLDRSIGGHINKLQHASANNNNNSNNNNSSSSSNSSSSGGGVAVATTAACSGNGVGSDNNRHIDNSNMLLTSSSPILMLDGQQSSGSSGGESASSGSMLVAENGFVRFRALDDMGIVKHGLGGGGGNSSSTSGIQQQQPNATASFRTAGRSKERAYTNS